MGLSRCLTEHRIPMRPRSILTGCCRKKAKPSLPAPTVTSALDWTCRRITRSPGECRCRERSRPTQRRPCKLKIVYSRCCKRYSVANKVEPTALPSKPGLFTSREKAATRCKSNGELINEPVFKTFKPFKPFKPPPLSSPATRGRMKEGASRMMNGGFFEHNQ